MTSVSYGFKMASEILKSLKLQVIHGPKKYEVKLQLPSDEAGDALCVKHLTAAVYKLTEIPPDSQKLIFKGKSLTNPDDVLALAGMKNGTKVMLIGKRPVPEDDEDVKSLGKAETAVDKLEKKLSDITYELDGIHRGYLQDDLRIDALKQLENQMGGVSEKLMKLLEKLDTFQFEETNRGARGKRKTLVDRIQVLLNRVDDLTSGVADTKEKFTPTTGS